MQEVMYLDILTEVFNGADFPLASDTVWPESFSYENHGTICFIRLHRPQAEEA